MDAEPDAEPGDEHFDVLTRHRRDRAVMAVVFLLLFGFSYSEDYVFAILRRPAATRPWHGWWDWSDSMWRC